MCWLPACVGCLHVLIAHMCRRHAVHQTWMHRALRLGGRQDCGNFADTGARERLASSCHTCVYKPAYTSAVRIFARPARHSRLVNPGAPLYIYFQYVPTVVGVRRIDTGDRTDSKSWPTGSHLVHRVGARRTKGFWPWALRFVERGRQLAAPALPQRSVDFAVGYCQ